MKPRHSINRFSLALVAVILFALLLASARACWLVIGDMPTNSIYITRVNEFETLSSTNGTSNFDFGDTNDVIVARYGGGRIAPTNTFVVGWPITIGVFFSSTNSLGAPYTTAKLEYYAGTTATDTNWQPIATLTGDQLKPVANHEGTHFGVATWTPPDVSNAMYLVRFYAETTNAVSADRDAVNITKDGDGVTWQPGAVVQIKVTPHKRPGF